MQDYLMECRRLRKENESLRMRIAELESAQQWHPASEPPEHDNFIALLVTDDKGEYSWEKARYANGLNNGVPKIEYRFADSNVRVEGTKFTAIGWRDLPPLPEAKP